MPTYATETAVNSTVVCYAVHRNNLPQVYDCRLVDVVHKFLTERIEGGIFMHVYILAVHIIYPYLEPPSFHT